MEIKKLSTIEFSVEAQKCEHKEYDKEGGCKADCAKTKYVDSNAIYNAYWKKTTGHHLCSTKTVWTCSTLCIW